MGTGSQSPTIIHERSTPNVVTWFGVSWVRAKCPACVEFRVEALDSGLKCVRFFSTDFPIQLQKESICFRFWREPMLNLQADMHLDKGFIESRDCL